MVRPLSFVAGCAVLLVLASPPVATGRQEKKDDPSKTEDPKDPVHDGKKASEWVSVLVNGTSARQRALAVEALARLWSDKRYEDSIFNIGRALRVDSSAAVRTQAAQALGGLRETEIKYLIAEKKGVGVQDLVDAMGKEKESRVRKELAKAIGRFPDVAKISVPQLSTALNDTDPATRVAVAEAIALAGAEGKSAAGGLAPLLMDQDKAVRRAAVIALGRINPEGASAIATAMTKMLAAEKDADLRGELVISLRLLDQRSPEVVAALSAVLTDPDEEVRRRAVRTLGEFGTAARPAADELLKMAALDKVKDIRVDAVHGFGSALGPDEVKTRVKELLALLGDPDFEVRIAAINEVGALGNELMKDEATLKVLRARRGDPHLKVRDAAGLAIRKIETKVEPKKDPEPKKNP